MVDDAQFDERTVGTRGAYRRKQRPIHTPNDGSRLVHCVCGTTLRVSGAWTCWTCGTCHRLWEREPEA